MKVRLNYMEPHEDNLIDNEAEEQALSEINATPPPAIAKTQELDAHPLSINEAIIQMDLMHNDFLVFVNAETNEVNVLYRREDEGLGLIETHARPS